MTASIIKTPGVCGGQARIAGTRFAVWWYVVLRRQGRTDESIMKSWDYLTKDQLSEAWDYARRHPSEIDREIAELAAVREKTETTTTGNGDDMREKLGAEC